MSQRLSTLREPLVTAERTLHEITEEVCARQMVDQVMAIEPGTRLMMLAPVVQNRKGEHVQLLTDLQSQGFVRARIDGEVYELDDPPKLDLRRKHTIEVVVDRFKVREDLALRLAESFETTLKLADGLAKIAPLTERGRQRRRGIAVLRSLRLPDLQLQHRRTGTAAVLFQ